MFNHISDTIKTIAKVIFAIFVLAGLGLLIYLLILFNNTENDIRILYAFLSIISLILCSIFGYLFSLLIYAVGEHLDNQNKIIKIINSKTNNGQNSVKEQSSSNKLKSNEVVILENYKNKVSKPIKNKSSMPISTVAKRFESQIKPLNNEEKKEFIKHLLIDKKITREEFNELNNYYCN